MPGPGDIPDAGDMPDAGDIPDMSDDADGENAGPPGVIPLPSKSRKKHLF